MDYEEALKGKEDVLKGGGEVSKRNGKSLNCGDEEIIGDKDT